MLGLVVLFGALFAFGETKEASAEVRININLAPRRSWRHSVVSQQ